MSSTTPRARRRSPWVIASFAVAAIVVVAIAALVAWLSTPAALRYALDRAVAATEGKLAVEGVKGTLLGPMSADRVVWQDDDTRVVAENVRVDPEVAALASGRLSLRELRAERVRVDLGEGDGTSPTLPESLALPIDIDVDRVVVDTLEIGGDTPTTLSGVTFAYSSDNRTHHIRGLRVNAEGATLTGSATVGTVKPFATRGAASLVLDKPHPQGRIDAKFEGNLEALDVALRSDIAEIVAEGRARIAPFASQPFVEGSGTARDIDLARLDPNWPATKLSVVFEAAPAPNGFRGRLEVDNAAAGAVDANRLPLAQARARYELDGRMLRLAAVDARLDGGGSLKGSGTLDLDSLRSQWKLAAEDVDLKRVHGALVQTDLSGTIEADVTGDVQHVVGDLVHEDLRLAFDMRYDGDALALDRAVVESAGGSLQGRGRFTVAGAKPFAFEGRATSFDPARFGDFPKGSINAAIDVKGTFEPTLSAEANVVVTEGSRFASLPAQGRVQGRFTPSSVAGLDADVALGATRVRASGAYGRPGDTLKFAVSAPRLAQLAPLMPDDVPRPLAGAVDATGTLELLERGARVALDARGKGLVVGDEWRFGTLAVDASGVHAAPLDEPDVAALRDVALRVDLAKATTPQGPIDRASVRLAGDMASHTLSVDAASGGRSIDAAVVASLEGTAPDARWQGRVDRLVTRGLPVLEEARLESPTTFAIARNAVEVGAFELQSPVARIASEGVSYRNGALDTRGRFSGLSAETIVKVAAPDVRLPTDLVLAGAWNVQSSPEWRGTLSVRRERGDLYVDAATDDTPRRIELGIETLALDVKFDGRRATGNATLHAKLGGNAIADFELVAPPGELHPFDPQARLRADVRAHVPALSTLQPWIGTMARVQGQAIADVRVTGTLDEPVLNGQLVAYDLRYAMPQYGVNLRDGSLRVVSGPEGLRIEELVFHSGDGRFVASGVVGLPGGGKPIQPRIQWHAEDFRALNRPEMRLVVDGQGTLAVENGRLVVRGRVDTESGYIEYRPRDETKLADDIVVVGRPRPGSAGTRTAGGADMPVDLDLEVDFGGDLRFVGEGVDTRVAGRVRVTTKGGGPVLAKGAIRTVRGTFTAFGQRLDIDRGRLIFDGPIDNPSLDIVALRKNQPVEAGVQITGNVRTPIVRLTSDPPVPDTEKLSWLLTGGPPGSASATESAALSAATAALLGRGGGVPLTKRIAERIGLDDISIGRRYGSADPDAVATQMVTFGKRLTDRLYVAYEQGLSAASNALRLEYILSRYLTLSAFTGTTNGIALNFRRSWR